MGPAAQRARAKERPPEDVQHSAAGTPVSLTLTSCRPRSQLKPDRLHYTHSVEMEDFEYSVEICDRDWECFFAECEECNLLPPSLAGLDSGMSDFDETGSKLKRFRKVDLTSGVSEADRPIDGPPDCEGSPVEHYLSKRGAGAMESVLSGSEEDTHLQSVNIFFERLKNLSETERLAEPCQERAGGNREAAAEEEQCSDGQRSRGSTLPKNIPKLNSPPARGETAVGAETPRPVDAISNINTKKKVESGSNISSDSAASNSVLKTNTSASPETELFIREEAGTQSTVNEAAQWNQFCDLPESETPHTDKVIEVQMCTPLKDAKQEHFFISQFTESDKCNKYSPSNAEMVTRIKRKEEHNPVLQVDATSLNKSASPESSPSASIKRKRRKKRRLSFEPADSARGYERRFLVKPSDSEEEQYSGRGGTGLCLPEDVNLFYSNAPQNNAVSSLYSVSSRLPVRTSAKEIKTNECSHIVPPGDSRCQYTLRRERCKAASLAENNATNNKSVTPCVDNVISVTSSRGNVETDSQPCMKLQVEESTGLNKHPWLAVSVPGSVTVKSDRKPANSADSLHQANKVSHSISGCENEHNLKRCTAEVNPSTESDDRAVGVGQNDKLSDAKSVLAAEAGNSVRDDSTPCHGQAEPQQQLEIERHDTDRFSSALDNTKPQQFNTTARPFILEISSEVTLPDTLPRASTLDINNTVQQTERPLEIQALSKLAHLAASQLMSPGNPGPSVEIISQRKIKLSTSKDLITSPSDITSLSSLLTESGTSLSNGNITDLSGSFSSSVRQNESGGQTEKTPLMLFKHEDGEAESGPKRWSESSYSTESKWDSLDGAEEAECEPENAPDSKHTVFAMSSFWGEMEKLTINDILGLRSLPPLPESQETDVSALTDSGFFTQSDESKLQQTSEHMPSVPDLEKSSSGAVAAADSSISRSVLWESEPVPMRLGSDTYTENVMMTSVRDISQSVFSGNAQQSHRKISKTLSVHNLAALDSESFSSRLKGQTLQTLDEEGSEKFDCLFEDNVPKQADMDSLPSSFTDGYRISVSDIFQYLFGGKQSIPSQSATDNITNVYADGNSVPENYDHFFSEYDTETFFCPLLSVEDQAKGEQVPIFSSSRSACRNLQFPEAYEGFFASSSSDDSSVESDEEDNCRPVRVVTRFSHNVNSSQISTDIYDNFFTDSDLRENFFWKATLSFRNMNLSGIKVQKQTLSSSQTSHVPVRQSGRSLQRTLYPSNALGNQDVMFPDPLLYHLEDMISRQQALQPFRNQDLQTSVSNPRLDSLLLPLRQSDMCLVCIAFASWVLKTANPQVGDAWKAVLLANVSALSAIRYLRKYVKMEAAASEKELHHN
ncbi:PGC-1 and ERR-induced regulator in muscle protein 1 [Hippoglossus stenolepis]|uniref:PGC-1 and ERR-induced regulator in muscle protein 1 n=1 Tax=Hippoglossus stenolepis TaxID=195615 RepID=UPI001FAFFB70|nr:PGC-1 and ERR-induced regulator in muscle protein 1 [Hippoglossus stenolepis]